jgi:hypothetical protein
MRPAQPLTPHQSQHQRLQQLLLHACLLTRLLLHWRDWQQQDRSQPLAMRQQQQPQIQRPGLQGSSLFLQGLLQVLLLLLLLAGGPWLRQLLQVASCQLLPGLLQEQQCGGAVQLLELLLLPLLMVSSAGCAEGAAHRNSCKNQPLNKTFGI